MLQRVVRPWGSKNLTFSGTRYDLFDTVLQVPGVSVLIPDLRFGMTGSRMGNGASGTRQSSPATLSYVRLFSVLSSMATSDGEMATSDGEMENLPKAWTSKCWKGLEERKSVKEPRRHSANTRFMASFPSSEVFPSWSSYVYSSVPPNARPPEARHQVQDGKQKGQDTC